MSESTYRCCSCMELNESFLYECSHCGSRKYERVMTDSETEASDLEADVAKLSRPLNPLVPA